MRGLRMSARPFCLVWWPVIFLPLAALHAETTSRRIIVTAQAPPSVQEIMQRALANDELRRQHRLALECDQTIITERLDDKGDLLKHKSVRITHCEEPEFAYSTDAEIPSEHRAHQDGDTAKAEHRMAVMNLRQLAPRFQCTVTGEAPVRGRACYIVEYTPRRGQPSSTREEKVINQLHGRFWIDQKNFEILQGEGSLAAPVSVALLSSVTGLDFAFHTQTMPNGEAGPADFSVDLTVKAPFYFYRQQQMNRLENWRPARD